MLTAMQISISHFEMFALQHPSFKENHSAAIIASLALSNESIIDCCEVCGKLISIRTFHIESFILITPVYAGNLRTDKK